MRVKYVITDENEESVSLEREPGNSVELSLNNAHFFLFTIEEFKEFRRAIGYIWQEVEDK